MHWTSQGVSFMSKYKFSRIRFLFLLFLNPFSSLHHKEDLQGDLTCGHAGYELLPRELLSLAFSGGWPGFSSETCERLDYWEELRPDSPLLHMVRSQTGVLWAFDWDDLIRMIWSGGLLVIWARPTSRKPPAQPSTLWRDHMLAGLRILSCTSNSYS